jgi:2-polyprenyl-6-methoxyphenol hydroxylase-like FAD-dependent oxidoreductase
MCLALALARRRRRVTVIDAGWRPASHTYGVALHPESLDLLDELGVLGPLQERGQRVEGLLLYESGEQRGWMGFNGLATKHSYVLAVPQAALEEELVAALSRANVGVLWNHRASALAGGQQPTVLVERLEKESSGYSYATNVWVVDKTWELKPSFVIGTDGHDSFVRRALGIGFEAIGEPRRFMALEMTVPAGGAGRDVRVLLGDGHTDAMWPLPDGGCRCTLELPPSAADDSRRAKERARWAPSAAPREELTAFAASRLPWLQAERCALGWAAVTTFEQRLAQTYGDGSVWLAGDAAHVATPLGVHSLNVGLREAAALAGAIDRQLEGAGSAQELRDYESTFRAEWKTLLGATSLQTDDPWMKAHGRRILAALPASGRVLAQLLRRLNATAPGLVQVDAAGAAVS